MSLPPLEPRDGGATAVQAAHGHLLTPDIFESLGFDPTTFAALEVSSLAELAVHFNSSTFDASFIQARQ